MSNAIGKSEARRLALAAVTERGIDPTFDTRVERTPRFYIVRFRREARLRGGWTSVYVAATTGRIDRIRVQPR